MPDAEPDAGPPPVRFVVMGDTGEGNQAQLEVAQAVSAVCATQGCDFVLLLGDNIYDDGVDSVDDPQWRYKFEIPYADVDAPFFAVLGNHDYGGQLGFDVPGLGNEWWKGPLEVQYSERSDKWVMPATHYTFTWGRVGFIVLDTNSIVWDSTTHGDQAQWYPAAVADLQAQGVEWIFAAGHHPYRSNGSHGNAGSYDALELGGVELPIPIPELSGVRLRRFFDEQVCGTVDVYLSGHDHDREWLDEPAALCGAELIVSGAGSKLRPLKDRGNRVHWQDDSKVGFLYVEIDDAAMTGRFYDSNGAIEFSRQVQRPEARFSGAREAEVAP